MSTRTSLFYKEGKMVDIHLYKEMHDSLVHLELTGTHGDMSLVNIIIPEQFVEDFRKGLEK